MRTVGFVGLGNMGRPMARNLRQAGFDVVAFDIDPAVSAAFVEEFGGAAATAPADFGSVEAIVTMLPDGKVVAQALLEAGGIADGLPEGTIVVDMSSSSPLDTRETGLALADRGLGFVDAPVSGGIARADTGELTLMVGGDDPEAIERVRPILEVLGGKIVLTGPLGSGHAMKALNNFCGAASYVATAEALAIGQQFGLGSDVMISVLSTSTGRSFNTDVVFPEEVLTGRYATNFALSLLAKDVGIAASLAASSGMETPAVELTSRRWAQALATLGPGHDQSEAHRAWWDVVLAAPAAASSTGDGN